MTPDLDPTRHLNLFQHAAVSNSAAHRVRTQAQLLANPTLLDLVRALIPFVAMPCQPATADLASPAAPWDDLLAHTSMPATFVTSTPNTDTAGHTNAPRAVPRTTLLAVCYYAQQMLLGSLSTRFAEDAPEAGLHLGEDTGDGAPPAGFWLSDTRLISLACRLNALATALHEGDDATARAAFMAYSDALTTA